MLTIAIIVIAVIVLMAYSFVVFMYGVESGHFDNASVECDMECPFCGYDYQKEKVAKLPTEFKCTGCDRNLELDVIKTLIIRKRYD